MNYKFSKFLKVLLSGIIIFVIGSIIYKILNMDIGPNDIQKYDYFIWETSPFSIYYNVCISTFNSFPDSILAIGGGTYIWIN
ncbi:hypothetical protein Q5M85_13555 [Paraclostridium bifermentans]|nr:hypothetical protein [Paraclostridium bifermentans]